MTQADLSPTLETHTLKQSQGSPGWALLSTSGSSLVYLQNWGAHLLPRRLCPSSNYSSCEPSLPPPPTPLKSRVDFWSLNHSCSLQSLLPTQLQARLPSPAMSSRSYADLVIVPRKPPVCHRPFWSVASGEGLSLPAVLCCTEQTRTDQTLLLSGH